MRGSGRFVPGSMRARRQVVRIVVGNLLLIWLVTYFPSLQGHNSSSWFVYALSRVFGISATLWMMWHVATGETRLRWFMLLLNQVLGMVAMVLYGVRALLTEQHAFSMGIPVLFFIFGAIPSLLAISCEFNERETRLVRILDIALVVITGILFVILVFSLVNPVGRIDDAGLRKLNLVLAAQGVFIAVGATLRLFGTVTVEERRFFFVLSAASWITVVLTSVRNYMTLGQVSPFGEIFWNFVAETRALVIFVMIVAVYQPPAWLRNYQASRNGIRLSRISTSLFIGTTLVILGTSVASHHFLAGSIGLFLMLMGYSLRNALILEGFVETEESLLVVKSKLEEMVALDGLTGIPNRRSFEQTFEREWRVNARNNQPVGILMIDIDHFKMLNDTYGHKVGDQVLSRVAKALQSALPRTGDFVARYGGEEFVTILPGATISGMENVADRLRRAVHELVVENASGHITISIGAALGTFLSVVSPQDLLTAADMALYRAKSAGRDRVESIDLTFISNDGASNITTR